MGEKADRWNVDTAFKMILGLVRGDEIRKQESERGDTLSFSLCFLPCSFHEPQNLLSFPPLSLLYYLFHTHPTFAFISDPFIAFPSSCLSWKYLQLLKSVKRRLTWNRRIPRSYMTDCHILQVIYFIQDWKDDDSKWESFPKFSAVFYSRRMFLILHRSSPTDEVGLQRFKICNSKQIIFSDTRPTN